MTGKRKRRKKHMKSIILQKPGTCLLCEVCGIQGIPNAVGILERHHVFFGTSRRAKSEANGLTVMLCRDHHWIVHNDNQWNMWLKKYTQAAWELMPGHTREGWMEMIGKNYLDEEESILVGRIRGRNDGNREQAAAPDEDDAG